MKLQSLTLLQPAPFGAIIEEKRRGMVVEFPPRVSWAIRAPRPEARNISKGGLYSVTNRTKLLDPNSFRRNE